MFSLTRFLVYSEPFPCLFWTVSLFILSRFLVYFEPFHCLFWAVSLFILNRVLVYLSCFDVRESCQNKHYLGARAPLACSRPWRARAPCLSRPPCSRCVRLDGTLMTRWCVMQHISNNPCLFWTVSLFMLNRFLVYFEPFPCLCWAVSLFILNRFLVYFEPKPLMFILILLVYFEPPSCSVTMATPMG